MPRVSNTLARRAGRSHGHYRRTGDHHRLREVDLERRWKIILISAAQSRSAGADRRGWRGKSGGIKTTRKGQDVATALCRRAMLRLDTTAVAGQAARRLQIIRCLRHLRVIAAPIKSPSYGQIQ